MGNRQPFFPAFIQTSRQQPSCFMTNIIEGEKLDTLGKCPFSKYLPMSGFDSTVSTLSQRAFLGDSEIWGGEVPGTLHSY